MDVEKKAPSDNEELPSGIWKIERYGKHENGKWTEVLAEHHLIFFTFRNMCLTLQHGQTLIDHMSLLTEDVRILRKYESLGIIVVKENVKTKKLRLRFAGTGLYPGIIMIQQCLNKLKAFVRIQDVTPKSRIIESRVPTFVVQKECECKERKQPLQLAVSTQHTRKAKESDSEKFRPVPLSEHVASILSKQITDFYADNEELSALYPLQDIIESSILDPDFPSFVAQVNNVLTEKLKK